MLGDYVRGVSSFFSVGFRNDSLEIFEVTLDYDVTRIAPYKKMNIYFYLSFN